MEAVKNMEAPTTAAELCLFVHCCLWMSNSISDFYKRVRPLNDILKKAYLKAGKRKKSALQHITLYKLSWGTEHGTSIVGIQDNLHYAVKLTFLEKNHVMCVFKYRPKNSGQK